MPTTERMKPISLFVPFDPIERRNPNEPLIVSGYCFVNETVEGEGGIVLERAAMQAATPEYMTRRTIREMHGPHAAGVAESVDWDQKGCHLTARIVDPVARMKCEEGVYRGFSLRIRPTQRLGNSIKALRILENSLVDDGADPDCNDLLIHRAEGFDPDAEIEVEVLDSPSGLPTPEAAEEVASDPCPVTSKDAPTQNTSHQPLATSPTSQDIPPDAEQQAAVLTALRAQGLPQQVAAIVERAQISATVPERENLEGARKPAADTSIERYVKQKGSQWCVYSESGDELGCHPTREEAVNQLQAIEANKHKQRSEDDGDHEYRMERYSLRVLRDGTSAVFDAQTSELERFPTREEAFTRFNALTQVSCELSREDLTATIERLGAERETDRAELTRVQTALTSAQAELLRLQNEPAEAKAVVRYPQALTREFLANQGENAGGLARLTREIADLERMAQAEAEPGKRQALVARFMARKALLREEFGVDYDALESR